MITEDLHLESIPNGKAPMFVKSPTQKKRFVTMQLREPNWIHFASHSLFASSPTASTSVLWPQSACRSLCRTLFIVVARWAPQIEHRDISIIPSNRPFVGASSDQASVFDQMNDESLIYWSIGSDKLRTSSSHWSWFTWSDLLVVSIEFPPFLPSQKGRPQLVMKLDADFHI